MNLVYSGQVIALAQRFHCNHSLATASAMAGVGVGMFAVVHIIENSIYMYGWRGSFIVCSALSIQLCVFGALSPPLPMLTKDAPDAEEPFEMKELTHNQQSFCDANVLSRPVSSLKLSLGTGYLSHSLLSLAHSSKSNRRSGESVTPSYNHSFSSRGIRSNQDSFSARDPPFDSLTSNNHSFSSAFSSTFMHNIRANPYSFSIKSSNVDLTHLTSPLRRPSDVRDGDTISLVTSEENNARTHINAHEISLAQQLNAQQQHQTIQQPSLQQQHLMAQQQQHSQKQQNLSHQAMVSNYLKQQLQLHEQQLEHTHQQQDAQSQLAKQSQESEHLDKAHIQSTPEVNNPESYHHQETLPRRVKLCDVFCKLKRCMMSFMSRPGMEVLFDPCFWLMVLSIVATTFGSLQLFIILKDFTSSINLSHMYGPCVSAIGIGDIVGRLAAGALDSKGLCHSLLLYATAMLLCGISVASFLLASSGFTLVLATTIFGVFYGFQNVLITVAPSSVFGKNYLVVAFGQILFWAGIGALVGPPICGMLVDKTQSYSGVMYVSSLSCITGSVFMAVCLCFATSHTRITKAQCEL